MRVPGTLTIVAVERLLTGLVGQTTDVEAKLPTRIRHSLAGGEAALVQLLATWAQQQRRTIVSTHAVAAEDRQLNDLVDQIFGLGAVLVADETRTREGVNIQAPSFALAQARLEILHGMKPRLASRGPQFELMCADHLGFSAPKLLYYTDPNGVSSLRDINGFNELANQVIAATVPDNMRVMLPEDSKNTFAEALYELFRNTEEHGRRDQLGNQLKRSLRGIHARRHAIEPAAMVTITEGFNPLAEWAARLPRPRPDARDAQMIELSVFDSGPGFAARWARCRLEDIEPDAEVEAIRQCFSKHQSSKSRSGAGLGLCNLIDLLRAKGGFLRLRTGRQSLYADLSIERERPYGDPPNLQPWGTGGHIARVAGTLVTVLLPLARG